MISYNFLTVNLGKFVKSNYKQRSSSKGGKVKVLLAGTDTATFFYMRDLLPALKQRGHEPILTLDGAAAHVALREGYAFEPRGNPEDVFLKLAIDNCWHVACVASGVKSDRPWEIELAEHARKQGVIWTGHEDMEMTTAEEVYKPLWQNHGPALIFIAEALSAVRLKEWGVPEEKIVLAGTPTWDSLVNLDSASARKVRDALGVKNDQKLITWLASKFANRSRQEWFQILPTFNYLRDEGESFVMLAVWHPGCTDSRGSFTEDRPYGIFQEDIQNASFPVKTVEPLQKLGFEGNDWTAASDLLISFASTNTLVAAHLGIPTLRPFTPLNLEFLAKQSRPQPYLFSPVATGCQEIFKTGNDWENQSGGVHKLRSQAFNQVVPMLFHEPTIAGIKKKCQQHYPISGDHGLNIVKAMERLHQ